MNATEAKQNRKTKFEEGKLSLKLAKWSESNTCTALKSKRSAETHLNCIVGLGKEIVHPC